MDYVSPKLDIIFKKIFEENLDLLQAFIADILELDPESIQDIVLSNTELLPDYEEGKLSRMDLNMRVGERLVNVEIQINPKSDYRDRALYYWAKLFTSGSAKGKSYDSLKQAITVNILDFTLFDDTDNYHTKIIPVSDNTGKVFSDKFAIHFFELKKVSERPDPADRKAVWMQFLNADSEEDFTVLQNNTDNPMIQKAVRVVVDMSRDTQIREAARLREKSIMDALSDMECARREGMALGMAKGMEQGIAQGMKQGIAKGMEQGITREREEMIRKMRLSGISETQIQSILSVGL